MIQLFNHDGIGALVDNKHDADTLLLDPPWDINIPHFDKSIYRNILAFTDGGRDCDIVNRLGAPTWLFTWDCVSSWFTPNRPLKGAKHCLAYFNIKEFDPRGFCFGYNGKPRIVTNSRGTYAYKPEGEKMFSDVYSSPITQRKQNHKHAKPTEWLAYLLAGVGARIVLDPFMGSGACEIACKMIGSQCFGYEISQYTFASAMSNIESYVNEKQGKSVDLLNGIA
jgi:hypothetical protein